MPSSKALTDINVGAGKLHHNVATAAADFQTSSGTEALLASMVAAVNQEIAVPTFRQISLTAGDTSFTFDGSLYGPIWLGHNGEVAADIFDLVEITGEDRVADQTTLEPITVTGITGASVATNQYTTNTITVNLSGAIPTTGSYRFLYSKRYLLGSFREGAVASARRFVPEPGTFESVIYGMKWNATGIGAWDSIPTSNLRSLAYAGLNERYNRNSTFPSGSPSLDTDGDGGLILRTGQGVTVQATALANNYSTPQPDPYLAQYKVTAGPAVSSGNLFRNKDGGTGFVGVLQQRVTSSFTQKTNAESYSVAVRMDVIEREFSGGTIGSGTVRTLVTPTNTTGTALNPDAGATDDERRTIRLGTGDYFWESTSGNDQSEVALGRDLVEVTFPGGEVQVYVITQLFGGPHSSSPVPAEDDRRALVRSLVSDGPEFPSGAATTGVSFRFIKTKYFSGVGTQSFLGDLDGHLDPVRLGYEYHAITVPTTTDPSGSGSGEIDPGVPEFVARAVSKTELNDALANRPFSLRWGGHDPNVHDHVIQAGLRGDGAVEASLYSRNVRTETIASSGGANIIWHPSKEGSMLEIIFNHASGSATRTVSMNVDYINDVAKAGDEIVIVVRNSPDAPDVGGGGGTATGAITFDATHFLFSGNDGAINTYNDPSGTGVADPTIHQYRGIYSTAASKFLMTLTTYVGPGNL